MTARRDGAKEFFNMNLKHKIIETLAETCDIDTLRRQLGVDHAEVTNAELKEALDKIKREFGRERS